MRGKFRLPGFRNLMRWLSFNEARALCAGSFSTNFNSPSMETASMRPAHCAREVGDRIAQAALGNLLQ